MQFSMFPLVGLCVLALLCVCADGIAHPPSALEPGPLLGSQADPAAM